MKIVAYATLVETARGNFYIHFFAIFLFIYTFVHFIFAASWEEDILQSSFTHFCGENGMIYYYMANVHASYKITIRLLVIVHIC